MHMANAESLQDLFIEELKDLLDAEKQLTKALPKMAKKAESEALRSAFEEHLGVTENQIERLNSVFQKLGQPVRGRKCEGMAGLIKESQTVIKDLDRGSVLDAALILSAQKVEHYEMAGYGTVRTFASQLGHSEIASLLEESLHGRSAISEPVHRARAADRAGSRGAGTRVRQTGRRSAPRRK
jgi:ferritin-like metal-binding protein YciE